MVDTGADNGASSGDDRACALRAEPQASQAEPLVPSADYSHYTPDDYDYDLGDCWNCGGEGWVYGCSWDWQCDTYDEGEGTCLCTRPCHICHPPKDNPDLRELMAKTFAQAIEAGTAMTEGHGPKDESAMATPCAQSPSEDTK